MPETVERVLSHWTRWAERDDEPAVSIAILADRMFVQAPPDVRALLTDSPREIDAFLTRLAPRGGEIAGAARLAYGDRGTLRLDESAGAAQIADDDPRLVALETGADDFEWFDASMDEPCDLRVGVVEGDELLAIAMLQAWDASIAQVGVFTRADARGRGLAARGASAVIRHDLAAGLVPQWRSRATNHASTAVADRMGFIPLGAQYWVRVRPAS
jgi:hypothetical protein